MLNIDAFVFAALQEHSQLTTRLNKQWLVWLCLWSLVL